MVIYRVYRNLYVLNQRHELYNNFSLIDEMRGPDTSEAAVNKTVLIYFNLI